MAQSLSIVASPARFTPAVSTGRPSVSVGVSSSENSPPRASVSAGVNISSSGRVSVSNVALNIVTAPSNARPATPDEQGNVRVGAAEALTAGLSVASMIRSGGPRDALSIADAAAQSLGVNTNMSATQAINTLAPNLLSGITNEVSSTIAQAISGIEFPKIQFPGLGQVTLVLGAGPQWLIDRALSKVAIPPFVPGLTFNPAMVGAAISLIKIIASGNLGNAAKFILEDLVEDIKEQSGLAELEDQVRDQLNEIQGFVDDVENIRKNGINLQIEANLNLLDSAENQFVDNYNRQNPPQTITDEDGNVKVVTAPPPDTSAFTKFKESMKEVGNIVASPAVQLTSNVSNAAFQFGENVSNTSFGGTASRIGTTLSSAAKADARNLSTIVSFSSPDSRTPTPTSPPNG